MEQSGFFLCVEKVVTSLSRLSSSDEAVGSKGGEG